MNKQRTAEGTASYFFWLSMAGFAAWIAAGFYIILL
jgi:hypothetical protein